MKHCRWVTFRETGLILSCGIPDPADLETRVRTITETVSQGIPNYFGLQRFGATRPVTHLVGEWILKRDFEQAVVTYVGKEFPGEAGKRQDHPLGFLTTRDIPACTA